MWELVASINQCVYQTLIKNSHLCLDPILHTSVHGSKSRFVRTSRVEAQYSWLCMGTCTTSLLRLRDAFNAGAFSHFNGAFSRSSTRLKVAWTQFLPTVSIIIFGLLVFQEASASTWKLVINASQFLNALMFNLIVLQGNALTQSTRRNEQAQSAC